MCLHENVVYKEKASLLVHNQRDSYPHPNFLPKQVHTGPNQQVNRTEQTYKSQPVGECNWTTTTTLNTDINTENNQMYKCVDDT